ERRQEYMVELQPFGAVHGHKPHGRRGAFAVAARRQRRVTNKLADGIKARRRDQLFKMSSRPAASSRWMGSPSSRPIPPNRPDLWSHQGGIRRGWAWSRLRAFVQEGSGLKVEKP